MTGKTHAICGVVTMAAITATNLQGLTIMGHQYTPALGLITVIVGSYMPDIDLPSSKMGSKVKFISKRLKHRGITHTLLFPALLFALMWFLGNLGIPVLPELVLGFEVGWCAHIVADLCNKKGVPLLWPLTSKHFHVASFLTSSWQETVFIILWIGVNAVCVYFLLR